VHYRAVREVWAEWWRTRGEVERPAELRSARLREVADFEEQAWLTLVWAMRRAVGGSHLGEATSPDAAVAAYGSAEARMALRPCGERGESAWCLSVEVDGEASPVADIVVIPLPCELLAGPAVNVSQRLSLLHAALAESPESDRIVLYPGTQHDVERSGLGGANVAHVVPLALPGGLQACRTWVIPVSPLDLESVERVERALRWYLLSSRYQRYPRRVGFPPPYRDLLASLGFVVGGPPQDDVVVVGIATDREERAFRAAVEDRARELELLPRSTCARDAVQLREACAALLDAARQLVALTACPVCERDGVLQPRDLSTYEVSCSKCEARWGLRYEPETGSRIPYLWAVGGDEPLPPGADRSRWLGRDALAEPCHSEEATFGSEVINPFDGRCSAGVGARAACLRCTGPRQSSDVDPGEAIAGSGLVHLHRITVT
jgi:hypothetical protein